MMSAINIMYTPRAFGGGNVSGPIDVATCLTHHGHRLDFDVETFIVRRHAHRLSVARLTPGEQERLQGMQGGYTKLETRPADGPRLRSVGNSMAVPAMAWVASRIDSTGAKDGRHG